MKQDIKDYLHLYPEVPIAICEPNTEPVSHYLEGIDWYLDKVIAERVDYPFEWVKPILRPLSDMTQEEEDVVATMCFGDEDFIITYRGMGYDDDGHEIHNSVKCLKIETFCELKSVNDWLPAALVQVDYEDLCQPIILGRFEDRGMVLKDDMIEQPFELARFLLSKHFDLFGLIDARLAIDKTTQP